MLMAMAADEQLHRRTSHPDHDDEARFRYLRVLRRTCPYLIFHIYSSLTPPSHQAFTFIGGLFVWFFVPETKGLSLEEMDEVFGSVGVAAADQERMAEISKRIGLDAFDDDALDKRDADSDDKIKTEV